MERRICRKYDVFYSRKEFKNCKFNNSCLNNKQISKIELPNLEQCPALYTKYDYVLERKVHENVIKLEELFKHYQETFVRELKIQKEQISNMWFHSQRYLILARSGICVKPYPEIISLRAEKSELCQFYTSLKKIKTSNCLLDQAIEKIRTSFSELINLCKQLDLSIESPFVNGSLSLKSLADIKTILEDLLGYFCGHFCTMKSLAKLLDPADAESIENYLNFISDL